MLDHLYQYVGGYIGSFMHPGVILLLIACGMGLPIPEDLILVASGAAVAASGGYLPWMILAAFFGVLAGDMVTFTIGRRFGQSIASTRGFGWMFTEDRVRRIRSYFERYGDHTIFVARFIAGLRALTFLMAGSMGVPPRRFLAINLVAALVTVPAEVSLGYLFASQLPRILGWIRRADLLLGVLGVLLLAGWILYRRRRRAGSEAPDVGAVGSSTPADGSPVDSA